MHVQRGRVQSTWQKKHQQKQVFFPHTLYYDCERWSGRVPLQHANSLPSRAVGGAGWEAAVGGCLQPACVSHNLVQSGRVTSSGGRKLQERSGEGSLCGNRQAAILTVCYSVFPHTPFYCPRGPCAGRHGRACGWQKEGRPLVQRL